MITFQELHRWQELQFERNRYNSCHSCKQMYVGWFDSDGNPALKCIHCNVLVHIGLNLQDKIRKEIYG